MWTGHSLLAWRPPRPGGQPGGEGPHRPGGRDHPSQDPHHLHGADQAGQHRGQAHPGQVSPARGWPEHGARHRASGQRRGQGAAQRGAGGAALPLHGGRPCRGDRWRGEAAGQPGDASHGRPGGLHRCGEQEHPPERPQEDRGRAQASNSVPRRPHRADPRRCARGAEPAQEGGSRPPEDVGAHRRRPDQAAGPENLQRPGPGVRREQGAVPHHRLQPVGAQPHAHLVRAEPAGTRHLQTSDQPQ